MKDIEILEEKFNLAIGADWSKIRTYMLDEIVKDSLTQIEPLLIQGKLMSIAKTDEWIKEFKKEKERQKGKKE